MPIVCFNERFYQNWANLKELNFEMTTGMGEDIKLLDIIYNFGRFKIHKMSITLPPSNFKLKIPAFLIEYCNSESKVKILIAQINQQLFN